MLAISHDLPRNTEGWIFFGITIIGISGYYIYRFFNPKLKFKLGHRQIKMILDKIYGMMHNRVQLIWLIPTLFKMEKEIIKIQLQGNGHE